tara:strand:- start:985 stop:2067 length:1083 start_codon:yes stop_codon:yes gene_type:complete
MDLKISDLSERNNLLAAISKVLEHGIFIQGEEHNAFEKAAASYCNRRYCIAVNSGTDALFLALRALGIGKGDEVITTALSWIATANAIHLTGAKPIFADITKDLNIDPASVLKLINDKTRAILPVHYGGRICDMNALCKIAKEYNIHLVEDASQAFGAKYDGRISCSFGEVACVSLNPMKTLAACGEAGIILTDRHDLKEKLEMLRYNGMINREICEVPSLNGRMDTIQAAILLHRIKHFEEIITRRREIAHIYNTRLSDLVITPTESASEYNVYYNYIICTPSRDKLLKYLLEKGVEAKVRDSLLMPSQPAYKSSSFNKLPTANSLIGQLISLPANEKLSNQDIYYVCDIISKFFNNNI